jgi:hypothetical protein
MHSSFDHPRSPKQQQHQHLSYLTMMQTIWLRVQLLRVTVFDANM